MYRLPPVTPEPVEPEKRKYLSGKGKGEVFLRQNGNCAACEQKITGKPEYDHIIPLALGGSQDSTNWQALHPECHALKTKCDVGQIAKAKRQGGKTGQAARRERNGSRLQSRNDLTPPKGMKYDWKMGRYIKEQQP